MVIICDYGIVLPTLFSISGYWKILEWLMMIQSWLINGDYMWLWHCFTDIMQY